MTSFLLGVASSLVASGCIILFARWRWPWLFGKVSGSFLFGHGVDYCYVNQAAAEPAMTASFLSAKAVSVLSMRAFSITEAGRPFRFLLDDRSRDVRLLLADPGDHPGDNASIEPRTSEFPGNPSAQSYRRGLYTSIEHVVDAMRTNHNVRCRLHSNRAIFRLFICDDYLYASSFQPDKSGAQLPVLRIRRASPLYIGFQRLFEHVWLHGSRDVADLKYNDS